MTLIDLDAVGPPGPSSQVSVKVVVCVRLLTVTEPVEPPVELNPLSPDTEQEVVLLVFQVSVVLLLRPTVDGVALKPFVLLMLGTGQPLLSGVVALQLAVPSPLST